MPLTVPSSITTSQPYIPINDPTKLGRLVGAKRRFGTLTLLNAAVSDERTAITASLPTWVDGEELTVSTEPKQAVRYWATSGGGDARNFRVQQFTGRLAADSNTIFAAQGVPSSGTGADGDYAYDESVGLVFGPKASGAWPAPVSAYKGPGAIQVNALTSSRSLTSADMGALVEQQSASNLTLTIPTAASLGVTWQPGRFFFAGSGHTAGVATTGTLTLAAASGVTITNIDSLTVRQDATPLVVRMGAVVDNWLVQ